MTLRHSRFAWLFALPIAAVLGWQSSFAQTSRPPASPQMSPEAQWLRALFDEVHLLRSDVVRVQIAAQRARVLSDQLAEQRQRVTALVEQIAAIEREAAEADDDSENELLQLQIAITQAPDAVVRARLTDDYEALRVSTEWQRQYAARRGERARRRQQELAGTLGVEQQKLAELQNQLTRDEQTLAAPR